MFYITEKKKYELHEINLKKLRKYFTKGRSIYRKGLGLFSITLVCVPPEKTSFTPPSQSGIRGKLVEYGTCFMSGLLGTFDRREYLLHCCTLLLLLLLPSPPLVS